ncbi:MAG: Na+/H+ antiporter NhaC family protein, partial [Candidatus Babeliales bacterium]|nr:Na+/H+ antiporter NhaC family protein [Candidatus Babeliales bacterium]
MILVHFLPILLFVSIYVGSGIYFSALGMENAFYQLSPTVAIIPAIALGWLLYRGTTNERMRTFIDGVRHPDIITMCVIFLLAGAFTSVTGAIGSVDSTVNLALSLISPQFLLIGIFITAAFISIAIGSSMGTIATIAPIAASLAAQGVFSPIIGMATVVSGAMFGDNLSPISDTTIAAVMSQEADMKSKLRLNARVALVSSIITIAILFFAHDAQAIIGLRQYSLILVMPYLLLIGLALMGINVFIVLFFSIICAGFIGYAHHGYTLFALSADIIKGFMSMHEIMVLSLMVGGLSGLAGSGSKQLTVRLSEWISKVGGKQKTAQLVIAGIVGVFDLL